MIRAMRAILHMDMDQFYAAVEIRDNPRLKGKPVIVGADPRGGKGRGVVSTASYEARRFGVHSAQPISQAWKLCPQGVYLTVAMDKYGRESAKIRRIFESYTPLVEPLSLDEAFLDVTASQTLFGRPEQIARKIKDDILHQTGLTCSAGVAANKLVAKIASDLKKPDGLVVVEPGKEPEFLAPLAVGRLWGVGKKSNEILRGLGIKTVADVAGYPAQALRTRLGSWADSLKRQALGLDERPVESGGQAKSVGRETAFRRDTGDKAVLTQTLADLAEDVAQRLRTDGILAGLLTLKLRWEGFETHTRQAALDPPTDHGPALLALGKKLLGEFLAESKRKVRLVGLSAGHLAESGTAVQQDLFGDVSGSQRRADSALDALNARFGEGTLKRASQLPPKGRNKPSRNKTGFSR
jgi:nucleotidyltransferase/DNA polymerase involved in DNA repair